MITSVWYPIQQVGLTGGVSPASNCFGSSVCQRQSAYHQKLVFRCGEMAVFKHAYDVSLTWVLLSSVNITFIFSKKWMLGATLTGVCCRDTFAFWALFFIDVSKAKSHDQRQSNMNVNIPPHPTPTPDDQRNIISVTWTLTSHPTPPQPQMISVTSSA